MKNDSKKYDLNRSLFELSNLCVYDVQSLSVVRIAQDHDPYPLVNSFAFLCSLEDDFEFLVTSFNFEVPFSDKTFL